MHSKRKITMKEWMNRVWEFACSQIATHGKGNNVNEEESWLGI